MKVLMQLILAASLSLAASTATAAAVVDTATRTTITEAIHKLVPKAKVDSITASPLPGLYQVVAGGQVVYVSGDGKYMLQGSLYDMANRRDLTAERMNKVRQDALAAVPDSRYIEFAPKDPKYHVTVFTDIDCGYCRKLHEHIAEFNKEGIAVDYLFFPRAGIGSHSYEKAVSVWCADDPKAALTAAKTGAEPSAKQCDNPVADDFSLGMRLGVTGTPAIIAADGSLIGGYLTPQQMLQQLQAVAARMQADQAKGG